MFIFITFIRLERYPLVLQSTSVSMFISGLLSALTNSKRLIFHLLQASHMPGSRGVKMAGLVAHCTDGLGFWKGLSCFFFCFFFKATWNSVRFRKWEWLYLLGETKTQLQSGCLEPYLGLSWVATTLRGSEQFGVLPCSARSIRETTLTILLQLPTPSPRTAVFHSGESKERRVPAKTMAEHPGTPTLSGSAATTHAFPCLRVPLLYSWAERGRGS